MAKAEPHALPSYRLIVVGGHTRSIGKTQLVCDLISALPEADFIAGKITQYGHGVCAVNGEHCGCAPDEHASAFAWETSAASGTDSARFRAAGARLAFWLRTKQGFLAEGMPVLRESLKAAAQDSSDTLINLIVESNSLLRFLKPTLYLAVLDPRREDFKPTAQSFLDRADAFVLRHEIANATASWPQVSAKLLQARRAFLQTEGQPLPPQLLGLVRDSVTYPEGVRI